MTMVQNGKFRKLQAFVVIFLLLYSTSCTGPNWNADQPAEIYTVSSSNLALVLDPEPEDVPYFKAIAEDQEKQLGLCKDEDTCRRAHFLRALSALYENRELAALHFRKVVVSRPNSLLAGESRFWLWFLDVLNTPNSAGLTSHELIKRLTREVVSKELSIHELTGKLENSSVDSLKNELAARDGVVKKLNQAVASLTKQLEQAKKEQVIRQDDVQQALKASEKKVDELTNQLEALRRIDQEIREKVPPTRPSEKMTPSPEVAQPVESNGVIPKESKP
jgi:TolA-binding protein